MPSNQRPLSVMDSSSTTKKYGIRMTLPPGDPMCSAHLLGDDWESYRWYATAEARDRTLREMRRKHPYYRIGDQPSLELTPVER